MISILYRIVLAPAVMSGDQLGTVPSVRHHRYEVACRDRSSPGPFSR
jgi:hypothetical protein